MEKHLTMDLSGCLFCKDALIFNLAIFTQMLIKLVLYRIWLMKIWNIELPSQGNTHDLYDKKKKKP